MKTRAFDITVRRIATGCDFHIRLFAIDTGAACKAARDRARLAEGIRKMDLYNLEITQGIAVFRVVSCKVSADQSRPSLGPSKMVDLGVFHDPEIGSYRAISEPDDLG